MSLSILFVDDEPNILRMLTKLVGRARPGWKVEMAENAEEALEKIGPSSHDVIVSDMRMPGMNGAELFERVRDLAPATGRLIMTGHSALEDRERALVLAHDFLAKPCTREDIIGSIERVRALQSTKRTT